MFSIIEFAYNVLPIDQLASIPFECANEYNPRSTIDLMTPPFECIFEPAKSFAQYLYDLHLERLGVSLQ